MQIDSHHPVGAAAVAEAAAAAAVVAAGAVAELRRARLGSGVEQGWPLISSTA
ncbi:hypothetical protein HaLaN_18795, partial [Haematococcus lacustris]